MSTDAYFWWSFHAAGQSTLKDSTRVCPSTFTNLHTRECALCMLLVRHMKGRSSWIKFTCHAQVQQGTGLLNWFDTESQLLPFPNAVTTRWCCLSGRLIFFLPPTAQRYTGLVNTTLCWLKELVRMWLQVVVVLCVCLMIIVWTMVNQSQVEFPYLLIGMGNIDSKLYYNIA